MLTLHTRYHHLGDYNHTKVRIPPVSPEPPPATANRTPNRNTLSTITKPTNTPRTIISTATEPITTHRTTISTASPPTTSTSCCKLYKNLRNIIPKHRNTARICSDTDHICRNNIGNGRRTSHLSVPHPLASFAHYRISSPLLRPRYPVSPQNTGKIQLLPDKYLSIFGGRSANSCALSIPFVRRKSHHALGTLPPLVLLRQVVPHSRALHPIVLFQRAKLFLLVNLSNFLLSLFKAMSSRIVRRVTTDSCLPKYN